MTPVTTTARASVDGIVALPQPMMALARGNELRLARAALKERVRSGEVKVSDVILTVPEEAGNMMIGTLLASQYRWAATRTERFLREIGMPETKTLGTMTDRQRHVIAGLLP
jgi:hypothetical protein